MQLQFDGLTRRIGHRRLPGLGTFGDGELDGRGELFEAKRLGEEGFDAEVIHFALIDIAEAADEDDAGNVSSALGETADEGDTVHDRHADVGDEDVDGLGIDGVQGFRAVCRGADVAASAAAQPFGEDVAQGDLVVDDEDACFGELHREPTRWNSGAGVSS